MNNKINVNNTKAISDYSIAFMRNTHEMISFSVFSQEPNKKNVIGLEKMNTSEQREEQ